MKLLLVILISLLSLQSIADSCTKISKFDESTLEIFIVCPDLPNKTENELSSILYRVFTENKFPVKDYVVKFVVSDKYTESEKLTKDSHLGTYHASDNGVTIWPKNKEKKRQIQLRI